MPMMPLHPSPASPLSEIFTTAEARAWAAVLACSALERSRVRLKPEIHAKDVASACDRWLAQRNRTKAATRRRVA